MVVLDASPFPKLKLHRSGKVREVFDLGEHLLLVATDRISAFDVVMANGIPDKGKVLNLMSAFWFAHLADVVPNHVVATELSGYVPDEYLDSLSGRSTVAIKTEPIVVECVARGYITGSLFKEYKSSGGKVYGLDLPDGLQDGSLLPEPIFTPATKASEGHDENVSFAAVADQLGTDLATRLRYLTLELYARAAKLALSKGVILADTKFEFGLRDGELIWIDEALTPDSSRYWDAASWEPGRAQPSYDKQFVRDYLEASGWDKTPPGPELPPDVVAATRAKYLEAYRIITGSELV